MANGYLPHHQERIVEPKSKTPDKNALNFKETKVEGIFPDP
jgi:hypothetical protein